MSQRWRAYRLELAFAAVLLAVVVGFAGTWTHRVMLRSARAELTHMVDGLRVAEIGYRGKHGKYLAFDAVPARPAPGPAPWVPPDGLVVEDALPAVRGSYRAELTKGGVRVIGEVDADGDGVPARVVATEDEPAKRETPDDVW